MEHKGQTGLPRQRYVGIVSCEESRPVESSAGKPDSEVRRAQRDFDQRNSRALSIIGLSLTDDILAASGIGLIESAADAWRKLESTYAARTLLSRLRLHQQFLSLSMQEGEDVQTFLNSVKSAAHELRASGFELSDEQVVLRIFEGLPESWQPMVMALEARDVRDLTLELVEALIASSDEPQTLQNALSSPEAQLWQAAIDDELASLRENNVYEIAQLPLGRRAIGCKFVFKVKRNADGSVNCHKARLVAKGYSQVDGVDFTETYATVVKFNSLRTLLSIATMMDLEIHQMDVKIAILNGDLEEEIYLKQPEIFPKTDERLVWRLTKSLYGLKPASTPAAVEIKLSRVMKADGDEHLYMQSVPYRSLMYLMVATRPEIAAAVGLVSRCTNQPCSQHWTAVKRIFRYLKGTATWCLVLSADSDVQLRGYCDADWANDSTVW